MPLACEDFAARVPDGAASHAASPSRRRAALVEQDDKERTDDFNSIITRTAEQIDRENGVADAKESIHVLLQQQIGALPANR